MKNNNQNTWWKGAVIYQIYPRSFQDSNNDGVGDLPGITRRLEYVASLGVDAIWISPFFTSPMKDFGYDISDYRSVDPMFGTLDDFKTLLSKARALNLKIIIDQVLSHTSDQHAWFIESGSDRVNEKSDWYVWADANPDGSPPNNWLSFFGGSAWEWHPTRGQYYLHNFLASQPDINFPRKAQLDNVQFWLDIGVDGFRLDVVNFYYHDHQRRSNPVNEQATPDKVGITTKNPYSLQDHLYDITQPENLDFLTDLRRLLDQYPGKTSIGEICAEKPLEVMADYTSDNNKIHMAYTFDLLEEKSDAEYIHSVIQRFEGIVSDGWACWPLGNHDVERIASRWGKNHNTPKFCKLAAAMLLSMRGSACIFQGDELGLPEADIPFEDIVDPYGKPFWPNYKGRDGCRTPMVWNTSTDAGFSLTKSWLPIDPAHLALSVENQESQPDSILHFFRDFLAWRKTIPALIDGEIDLLKPLNGVVAWIRKSADQKVLTLFNLTAETVEYPIDFETFTQMNAPTFESDCHNNIATLPAFDAFYAQLT